MGITTPPYFPDPAWEEAQRRLRGGSRRAAKQGGFIDVLGTLIGQLTQQAKPRADLMTPGSTGKLENARPYTFAGRVGNANAPEGARAMMQRPAQNVPEGEGGFMAMIPEALKQFLPQLSGAIAPKLFGAGMAKSFKPGPSNEEISAGLRESFLTNTGKKITRAPASAVLAKPNSVPVSPFEKMFPALINEKTGEIVHAMSATGPGGHRVLLDSVAGPWNSKQGAGVWRRGFVDPQTFEAFTEAALEQILANKYAAGR